MAAAKEEPKKEEPKKAKEGEEAWRYKHPTSHPDNKPPVTAVAKPSEENAKKYEDAVNAVLEKTQPPPPEEEPKK